MEKEILQTAGNFLNAVFCNADNLDGFVYCGIINTAVAEKDKATLIQHLEMVREFSDNLINKLKE